MCGFEEVCSQQRELQGQMPGGRTLPSKLQEELSEGESIGF